MTNLDSATYLRRLRAVADHAEAHGLADTIQTIGLAAGITVFVERYPVETSREVLRQWARSLGTAEVERDGSRLVVRGTLADGQEAKAVAHAPQSHTVRVSAPIDEIEAL